VGDVKCFFPLHFPKRIKNSRKHNEFSVCKAAERGNAVALLSEANAADGNSGKSFSEI